MNEGNMEVGGDDVGECDERTTTTSVNHPCALNAEHYPSRAGIGRENFENGKVKISPLVATRIKKAVREV